MIRTRNIPPLHRGALSYPGAGCRHQEEWPVDAEPAPTTGQEDMLQLRHYDRDTIQDSLTHIDRVNSETSVVLGRTGISGRECYQ